MGCGSLQIEGGVAGTCGVEQASPGRSGRTLQVLGEEMVEADPPQQAGGLKDCANAGLVLPYSTRTIWQYLDRYHRILHPTHREREAE
jgi:hypothetical protein